MAAPFRQPTLRERQREHTRTALFEAALEEFRQAGFHQASVARIARRAGVSRASFYFHFPTKEHVLLELQWLLEQGAAERVRGTRTLRAALTAFIDALPEAEARVGDAELFRDMIRVYSRRPEGLRLDDQPFPLLHEFARRFREGAQSGELRAGLEPAQASHLFLTSVFGYLIASDAPLASHRVDLETLVSLYLEEPRR